MLIEKKKCLKKVLAYLISLGEKMRVKNVRKTLLIHLSSAYKKIIFLGYKDWIKTNQEIYYETDAFLKINFKNINYKTC